MVPFIKNTFIILVFLLLLLQISLPSTAEVSHTQTEEKILAEENQTRFYQADFNQTSQDGSFEKEILLNASYNHRADLSPLVFYTEDFPPFQYMENKTLKGISVDILHEVYDQLDLSLSQDQIMYGSWEDGYRTVLNETGTAVFSTARSQEREELFLWAGPVFTDSNVIFSLSDNPLSIRNPEDLKKYSLGAVSDDMAAVDLVSLGYENITYASDAETLIQALQDGTIDGWANALIQGMYFIDRYAKEPDAILPVYTLKSHDAYFAFNRNTSPVIVKRFQETITEIRDKKDQEGKTQYELILAPYLS